MTGLAYLLYSLPVWRFIMIPQPKVLFCHLSWQTSIGLSADVLMIFKSIRERLNVVCPVTRSPLVDGLALALTLILVEGTRKKLKYP